MSYAALAADSPAVSEAVIADEGANFTQPLGSQIPAEAQADTPKQPASLDDSIDRAMAKSAAATKEKADAKIEAKAPVKAEVKAEPAKTERERTPEGKFAAKEQPELKLGDKPEAKAEVKPSHTASDAPARFTETAKAKWASADPEIRGEVSRMERELTDGYQKNRAAAERDSTLNEFHDMAKQSGKELHGVVREYVNMENLLRSDPAKGVEQILQRVGITPRQYAEHVLGQPADQQASQNDATIMELRNEIASLKQGLGGITQTFQKQQETATHSEVEKFAAQPEHARFDELSGDIAFFLKSDKVDQNLSPIQRLSEAFKLAERLNPAPAKAVEETASSADPDPAVQTEKGQKSISGAPDGLTHQPGKKRQTRSLDEALDRAFGHAG